MTKLQYAINFLKNGISVIPLRHNGKEPDLILTWEKYKNILPTANDLNRWLYSGWQNYGVICGWCNLVVIDFDDRDSFSLWLEYHTQYVGDELPFIVRTARGAHVYISLPGMSANEKRRGVDVKVHGYVVGPGCIHPSYAVYEALNDFHLVPITDLNSILPVELFPRVAAEPLQSFAGVPAEIRKAHTEYDAFQVAMFGDHIDLISRVKQSVRIEDMFPQARRTSLDGRWLSCLCPFHDDKNPSFWIDTRRQICGCATCLFKPMDVINVFARMNNLSDGDAVTALAKQAGVWG